jgi:hypothetical protein
LARADADAKAWEEQRAKEGGKDIKEKIVDLLESLKK